MSVAEIVRDALDNAHRAGVTRSRLRHLTTAQVQELADATVAFLRARATGPSDRPGWSSVSAAKAGVLNWYAAEAGLTEQEKFKSRDLRTEMYDYLEDLGLIDKGAGQGVSIQVSPVSPVDEEQLRGRVAELVKTIRSETTIAAEDYQAAAESAAPLTAVAAIVNAPSAGSTFLSLQGLQRADLSLEASVVTWSADLGLSANLTTAARARLDYYGAEAP